MTAIEIVSYDGEYPNLCFGRLKLKADGKEYVTSPGVLCPGEEAECYCDENWDEVVERGRVAAAAFEGYPWVKSFEGGYGNGGYERSECSVEPR